MTEPSEAAKAKRRQLVDALIEEDRHIDPEALAFATYIQQVSDAAKAVIEGPREYHESHLAPFILPEPVDPLVEAVKAACYISLTDRTADALAKRLPDELAKRGLKIVEASHDQ